MLHTLPDAILQNIFEQLDAPQLLALRLSCKTLARLLATGDLWKNAWKTLEPHQPLHQLPFEALGSRYDAYSLWRHHWWLGMQGVNAHSRAAQEYLALSHNVPQQYLQSISNKSESSSLITSEPILKSPEEDLPDRSMHSTFAHSFPQASTADNYIKKQPTWSPTGSMLAFVTRKAKLAVPSDCLVINDAKGKTLLGLHFESHPPPFFLYWSACGNYLAMLGSSGLGHAVGLLVLDVASALVPGGQAPRLAYVGVGSPVFVHWSPTHPKLHINLSMSTYATWDATSGVYQSLQLSNSSDNKVTWSSSTQLTPPENNQWTVFHENTFDHKWQCPHWFLDEAGKEWLLVAITGGNTKDCQTFHCREQSTSGVRGSMNTVAIPEQQQQQQQQQGATTSGPNDKPEWPLLALVDQGKVGQRAVIEKQFEDEEMVHFSWNLNMRFEGTLPPDSVYALLASDSYLHVRHHLFALPANSLGDPAAAKLVCSVPGSSLAAAVNSKGTHLAMLSQGKVLIRDLRANAVTSNPFAIFPLDTPYMNDIKPLTISRTSASSFKKTDEEFRKGATALLTTIANGKSYHLKMPHNGEVYKSFSLETLVKNWPVGGYSVFEQPKIIEATSIWWSPDGAKLMVLCASRSRASIVRRTYSKQYQLVFDFSDNDAGQVQEGGKQQGNVLLSPVPTRMFICQEMKAPGEVLQAYWPFADQYRWNLNMWAPDSSAFCYTSSTANSPLLEGFSCRAYIQQLHASATNARARDATASSDCPTTASEPAGCRPARDAAAQAACEHQSAACSSAAHGEPSREEQDNIEAEIIGWEITVQDRHANPGDVFSQRRIQLVNTPPPIMQHDKPCDIATWSPCHPSLIQRT